MRRVKPPLARVLGLLRLIRDGNVEHGVGHILAKSLKVPRNSPAYLREIAVLLELADEAEQSVNDELRLDKEGKAGLLHSLKQLRAAMVPAALDQPAKNFFPNIDLEISQFSLIAGFVQSDGVLSEEADAALTALDEDLTKLYVSVMDATIDEHAKKVVLANITALQVLLRNTELFGFDAAKSAYMDLLSAIQQQAQRTDEETASFLGEVWQSVETWAGRVTLINGAVYAGVQLIDGGQKLLKMIAGGK